MGYVVVGNDVSSYFVSKLRPDTNYRFAVRVEHVEGEVVNPVISKEERTKDGCNYFFVNVLFTLEWQIFNP